MPLPVCAAGSPGPCDRDCELQVLLLEKPGPLGCWLSGRSLRELGPGGTCTGAALTVAGAIEGCAAWRWRTTRFAERGHVPDVRAKTLIHPSVVRERLSVHESDHQFGRKT